MRRVLIVQNALQSTVRRFAHPARWGWTSVLEHARHAELYIHLESIGTDLSESAAQQSSSGDAYIAIWHGVQLVVESVNDSALWCREGIPLTGITVIVGVVSRNLVPCPFHCGQVKPFDRRSRTGGLFAKLIRTTFEDGNLYTFIVLNGTFEKSIQVGVAITGKAPGDAGVIAKTFGRARETLATVGVVLKARLGLEGAFVNEAILVHKRGVESLASVLRIQFVFGVGRGEFVREGKVGDERVREKEGREPQSRAQRGDVLLELGFLGGVVRNGREELREQTAIVGVALLRR
mmetsp:Transcript_45099/g.94583  ORF Transcript_45099/g.94583 Transcript_45099/m.94583 type:complete len:292 (-) Transcript_45099:261-1136(-)